MLHRNPPTWKCLPKVGSSSRLIAPSLSTSSTSIQYALYRVAGNTAPRANERPQHGRRKRVDPGSAPPANSTISDTSHQNFELRTFGDRPQTTILVLLKKRGANKVECSSSPTWCTDETDL